MTAPTVGPDLLQAVQSLLAYDGAWLRSLESADRVHLAVLVEPFLTYILEGKKTIESRFGERRSLPFERVMTGDVVLLKRSAGPVVAIARVALCESVELNAGTWPKVRAMSADICADEAFWTARKNKRYATLLRVDAVRALPNFTITKRDRRPWVIVEERRNLSTGQCRS
jgi:hypothetical protein